MAERVDADEEHCGGRDGVSPDATVATCMPSSVPVEPGSVSVTVTGEDRTATSETAPPEAAMDGSA